MKKVFAVIVLLILGFTVNGQMDMKINYSADSLVKCFVYNNMKLFFSPQQCGMMSIFAEKQKEYVRDVLQYVIFCNTCVESIRVLIPIGDETMNYTKSSDIMEFTRDKLKKQIVRIERGDDKTLYKLMLQDIPTCFGIA